MNVEQILRSLPNALGELAVVKLLKSGPAAVTWLIAGANENYVLRKDLPVARQLGLNRRRELAVLRIVGTAGLGPEVVFASIDDGILVTRYVDGDTWSQADIAHPANVDRIGRLMRRVHDLSMPGPQVDLASVVADYVAVAGTSLAAKWGEEARAFINRLSAMRRPRCLCHNDLVAGNIIATSAGASSLRLIDWEYAGLGEPLFDLAVLVQHEELSESAANALLAAWGGAGNAGGRHEQDLEAFETCRGLYDRLYLLWMLVAWGQRDVPAGEQPRLERLRARLGG